MIVVRATPRIDGRRRTESAGRTRRLAVIKDVGQEQNRTPTSRGRTADVDATWVEAVARRVAQLMGNNGDRRRDRLVDAATLAAELGVDRSWVYEHSDELGAVRLGTGSRPRLRFSVAAARATLAAQPQPRHQLVEIVPAMPRNGRGKHPPAVGRVLSIKTQSRPRAR
jgi:hypothetical protein